MGDGSDPKEGQARSRLQGDPLLGRGQQPLLEGLLLLYILPHSVAYMEGKPGMCEITTAFSDRYGNIRSNVIGAGQYFSVGKRRYLLLCWLHFYALGPPSAAGFASPSIKREGNSLKMFHFNLYFSIRKDLNKRLTNQKRVNF